MPAPLHVVTKAKDIAFRGPTNLADTKGHSRAVLMNRQLGSVHCGYDLCRLEPGAAIEQRLAAYETGIFVTDGAIDLWRDGQEATLESGGFALVTTATAFALRNRSAQSATWVEMMAPQPKPSGGFVDTFRLGEAPWSKLPPAATDLRDPRTRQTARFNGQMPARFDVHGDLSGFAIKMLMDREFGGVHFNMFIIEFADGGLCNHHDHPFEEAYLVLDGKVDIVFDGKPYVLERGDFAWTAVGSRHAFFPKPGQSVRWLEIQAPQPPVREWIRWHERWESLARKLGQV